MGEQNAIAPEGFDFGNSPVEITRERVQNACAVMATTNGTKALLKAASTGTPVLVACARNARAALDLGISKGDRIGIFCSGRKGRPAWDDTLCAGLLIAGLMERFTRIRLADSARLAHLTWSSSKDFRASLKTADHAVFLEKIGYGEDIAFSSEIDVVRAVPELHALLEGEEMRVLLRHGTPRETPDTQIEASLRLPAEREALVSGEGRQKEDFLSQQGKDLLTYMRNLDVGEVFFAGEGYRRQRRIRAKKYR
jgi:phosphosulfolactate phosphohydrolase-like enzyme